MSHTYLKDLREYIDALRALGECVDVSVEVDWNLEMGAIIRRCYETGAPAPLFTRITGIDTNFRAFGAPAATSRQKELYLCRVAISLGLPPTASGSEIVEALAAARKAAPIRPKIVASRPCKQNKLLGADVDLTRLPSPLAHAGDGGRYINTWGTVVVRTPDGSWTNWGIARVMLLDRNRMTGIVHPLQHLGQVHGMWKNLGRPTPFAMFQGGPPFIPFVSGMPIPAGASEVDYMGAYFGQPVELVKCETVDLEVPATSEIVIEGYISDTETAMEGPMGEYAGISPREKARPSRCTMRRRSPSATRRSFPWSSRANRWKRITLHREFPAPPNCCMNSTRRGSQPRWYGRCWKARSTGLW